MALRHRPLDILRIVVTPSDDDEVLQPTRDEELAVSDEPQVTRAEVGPLSRNSQVSAECLVGLFWFVPVALRDARVRKPNFSHHVRVTTLEPFWVNDDYCGFSNRTAAADDRARIRLILTNLAHKPFLKRSRIETAEAWCVLYAFARKPAEVSSAIP